jgi:enterochelin esterase-like enzyme
MRINFDTWVVSGNLVSSFSNPVICITDLNKSLTTTLVIIASDFLHRDVTVSVILPDSYLISGQYPVLLVNDGQDFEGLGMPQLVHDLTTSGQIREVVVVGVHANHDRLHEYGTASSADYAGRGSKAAGTTGFIVHELIPFLMRNYSVTTTGMVYAGFSLGGLMALDIAWNHSDIFSRVAVFSGALWWRSKALDEGYIGLDRIMHRQINACCRKPGLKFWFQTGTLDETDDRDCDGVIDSIQDTLEFISELERKGYRWGVDIVYKEVQGGCHNQETWARLIPGFLIWAFGQKYAS